MSVATQHGGDGTPTGEMERGRLEVRKGREWYDSIQGLRAVAMTLVFTYHLAYFLQAHVANPWFGGVRRFCTLGTDLFFCIAGAFSYKSVIREETAYWSFAGRRIRRIYPVYAFILVLYLLIEYVLQTGRAAAWAAPKDWVKNAFLLPALLGETPIMDVSWALAYIVAFYLLSPGLFWPVRKLAPKWRPAALVALLGLAIVASLLTGRFPLRVTLLLAGPLVWPLRSVRMPWVLVVAAVGGVWLRMADQASVYWRFSGSLVAVMAIVLGAAGGVPYWQRALSLKPLTALGYRSYSFYLCHGLPLLAFSRYVFPNAGSWALAAAGFASWLASLAFTEVVHRWIEVPWSLGKRGGKAPQALKGD